MSGFPAGWTVADDSDGATAPGVLVASEGWWNCHLTTDEVRRVLAVEPHRSGKWTVTEAFVRRHPDGSTSPDDWPTVEFHATRDDALLAARCMARGTWSERCPEHGEEPVTVHPRDEVRWDCGRIVPGYRPAPRESHPVSEPVFDALWQAAIARGAISDDPVLCLDDPGVGEALAAPGFVVIGDWDRDVDRVRVTSRGL